MEARKILFVIPTLDQSGAEKQLALLASRLPATKYQVEVCALTRGGPYQAVLEEAGVPVHLVGKRLAWDPWALWRLTGLIKRIRPDLVQTWLFAGNCYGRVAAALAGARRRIASERCVDSWKSRYQLAIDRRLAKLTDRVVANSRAVAAFYQRQGIVPAKLLVIPNAVEPVEVLDQQTRRSRLASIGVDDDMPTIGFAGRLWPQKRVQDLIWAVDVLRIAEVDARLIIVGDGPRRASLERFTKGLDLVDRVHFLGHRSDARDLMAAVDVVAAPSQFEGMPNVVLEAMAAGRPVVATQIAGMDEVVIDEETGLLAPPKQPFELAKALRRIIDDPVLARRLGDAGRQRALDHFSIEKMVESYERLYDEVLAG